MWIRGATTLQREATGWTGEPRDIEIVDGRIASVAEPTPLAGLGLDDIDGEPFIAAPGLINLHLHSNDNFFRGRHERLPLELYMLEAAVPWGLAFEPDERMLEVRTLLGAAELLLTGTTAVLDDCYHIGALRESRIDAVVNAYERIGMRAFVATDVADQPMPDTVARVKAELTPAQYAELGGDGVADGARLIAACEAAIERTAGRRLARATVAASAPQRVTDELLLAVAELAARHDLPWSTHLLETRAQAITGRERYGSTIVAHLDRLGVLDDRAVLAHGVWVTDADIELLAAAGATVAHNPTSNLRLGSGVAPVTKMLDAGVRVALGTDGIASNDAQNLFLEMRLAGCVHAVKGLRPERWISAEQVLDMATVGGAGGLRDPALGRIAAGAKADLVLLRRRSTAFTPLSDYARNLVFAEYGQSVDTVIVDGEVVVRGGRLTRIDLEALLAEADELAATFFDANAAAAARVDEFRPGFARALEALRAEPEPMNRFLPGE